MTAKRPSQKNAHVQYSILAVLLLITAAYHVKHIVFISEYLSQRIWAVRAPGTLQEAHVSKVEKEGAAAGLRVGDTLLEVNGAPVNGQADVVRAMAYARPGDELRLRVQHRDGKQQALTIVLARRSEAASDNWAFVITLQVLLPLLCVALGFWVAVLRSREKLAWILMALLLGFSQIFGLSLENQSGTLVDNLALAYKVVCSSSWIVWLVALGIYFPEPLKRKRYIYAMKALALIPALGTMVALLYIELAINNFALGVRFAHLLPPRVLNVIGPVDAIGSLSAIGAFFVAIIAKYFVASTPDAKRRLQLLYWGLFLAVVPTMVLVIAGSLLNKSLDEFPNWLELPCLLLTFLFPITLAYIIVVYRAMDIAVVVRQGVQYALARHGIKVLQAVLTGALVVMIGVLAQSRATTLPYTLLVISLGLLAIYLLGRGATRLARWIDRRFFRDSYNAEQLLMELSEEVRTIVEMRPLLETISHRISESLHVPRVAVLLRGEHPFHLAYAMGYETAPQIEFGENSATARQLVEAKQPTRVYLKDPNNWVNLEPEVAPEERGMLAKLQAELLIPLLAMGRLLGFISLSRKRSEEPYSRSDLQLLGSMATQAGLALENARLTSAVAEEAAQREAMKREVEIAREVQERLFPQNPPPMAELDYCGLCRPARGVGGDYYDFLLLPGGQLGVAVGDVSGKGISAALMMASLQASLRGQTMHGSEDMAELVGRVNRLVYEVSSPERYATFFFAQYDAASHLLTYVNAGHNPPIVLGRCSQGWHVKRLEVGGTVVGLLPQCSYKQDSLELRTGDVLVAFTDGISEAMNGKDEEWGEEKMLETLKTCDGTSAAETVACIMSEADRFTAGAKQYDDMTLVVLKVKAD
jgi:sigma-B regulation protein RsbU (phosphoserine phosphatase)